MPELPTVNLRPREFYGNPSRYAKQMIALQELLEKDPADGGALLLLAYFRWFGQDVPATTQALSRALASATEAKDTHMVDAIQTFWDGMVSTGKVAGRLSPLAKPKPMGTTQPKALSGAAPGPAAGTGSPAPRDGTHR